MIINKSNIKEKTFKIGDYIVITRNQVVKKPEYTSILTAGSPCEIVSTDRNKIYKVVDMDTKKGFEGYVDKSDMIDYTELLEKGFKGLVGAVVFWIVFVIMCIIYCIALYNYRSYLALIIGILGIIVMTTCSNRINKSIKLGYTYYKFRHNYHKTSRMS